MRAITPLKLFGRETERLARWQNLKIDVQNRDVKTQKMSILFSVSNTFIFGIQGLLLFYIGAGLVMFAVAWVIERLVLRHLVNQEGTTLLMATLGITYFLEGLGQTLFGSNIYKIDIGMPKDPVMILESTFEGGILVNKEDLYAALIAAAMVALLSLFFQKTATGRALRAVADDHQAAQSIGIPLNRIWVIVWCVAGVVALVAGIIWGSKLGVQFSLATVALRALGVAAGGGLARVLGAGSNMVTSPGEPIVGSLRGC